MITWPVSLHSEQVFTIVVLVLIAINKNLVIDHLLSALQLVNDKGQVALPRILKLLG
jgi:hypothetical protein